MNCRLIGKSPRFELGLWKFESFQFNNSDKNYTSTIIIWVYSLMVEHLSFKQYYVGSNPTIPNAAT